MAHLPTTVVILVGLASTYTQAAPYAIQAAPRMTRSTTDCKPFQQAVLHALSFNNWQNEEYELLQYFGIDGEEEVSQIACELARAETLTDVAAALHRPVISEYLAGIVRRYIEDKEAHFKELEAERRFNDATGFPNFPLTQLTEKQILEELVKYQIAVTAEDASPDREYLRGLAHALVTARSIEEYLQMIGVAEMWWFESFEERYAEVTRMIPVIQIARELGLLRLFSHAE